MPLSRMSTKHAGPPFHPRRTGRRLGAHAMSVFGLGAASVNKQRRAGRPSPTISLNNCSLNNCFSNSRNRVTLCRSKERVHATSTARKKRRPWRLGTIFYGNWAEPIEKSQIGRMIPRESKSFRLAIPSIFLGFFWDRLGLVWFCLGFIPLPCPICRLQLFGNELRQADRHPALRGGSPLARGQSEG
jgi:hypothetical protein